MQMTVFRVVRYWNVVLLSALQRNIMLFFFCPMFFLWKMDLNSLWHSEKNRKSSWHQAWPVEYDSSFQSFLRSNPANQLTIRLHRSFNGGQRRCQSSAISVGVLKKNEQFLYLLLEIGWVLVKLGKTGLSLVLPMRNTRKVFGSTPFCLVYFSRLQV